MVNTPLDEPEPITVSCKLCGRPLKACFYWVYDRWLRPTVHDRCADDWSRAEKARAEAAPAEREIPDRFQNFDPTKANARAAGLAQGFSPDSRVKTLAIIGVRGRGKSRLMWSVIQQFFDDLQTQTGAARWVEYFTFSDLITEHDRTVLGKVKNDRYVFIDDIGCVESYGRERAALQSIIRTRLQKQQWTFLTIDSIDFDPDFKRLCQDRALAVWIDE